MKNKKKGLRAVLSNAHDALRRKRVVAMVYFTLRFLVIAVMVAKFFNGDFESVFLCGLTLVLFLLPTVFERALMIDLPNTMEIIIMLFIFAAEILGEISSFYTTFKGWDTILHTFSGAMLGALGFSFITFLNKTDQVPVNLSPVFVATFAFCFAVTLGVVWEIYEFTADGILHTNMQKFGLEDGTPFLGRLALRDTMKDLIVDTIGAAVMSVIGYFSLKYQKGWVEKLLLKVHLHR